MRAVDGGQSAVPCVDGRSDVSDCVRENSLWWNELFQSDATCSYAGSSDEFIVKKNCYYSKFNFGNKMVNDSETNVRGLQT